MDMWHRKGVKSCCITGALVTEGPLLLMLVLLCRYIPSEEDLVIGAIVDRRGEVGCRWLPRQHTLSKTQSLFYTLLCYSAPLHNRVQASLLMALQYCHTAVNINLLSTRSTTSFVPCQPSCNLCPSAELHCGHWCTLPSAAANAVIRGCHAPQPTEPHHRRPCLCPCCNSQPRHGACAVMRRLTGSCQWVWGFEGGFSC